MAMALWVGFTSPVFSADLKVGVVSFEKILRESSAGKMSQQRLKDKSDALKAKLQKEKENLEATKKAFEREFLVLSPEKKAEKERSFRIRVNDFNRMQQDSAKELKGLEISLLNNMQKEVYLIANEIGKKKGYTLILEKKNAGVIYMPAQVDITGDVIKKYNAKMAKKK